jgi:hypothetical protein
MHALRTAPLIAASISATTVEHVHNLLWLALVGFTMMYATQAITIAAAAKQQLASSTHTQHGTANQKLQTTNSAALTALWGGCCCSGCLTCHAVQLSAAATCCCGLLKARMFAAFGLWAAV